jgi:outer membrane protein OmpA-like peptidoglycan-associated protein
MKVEVQKYKIKQVAVLYDQVRRDLYDELMKEFGKDLPKWDAEITPDLSVRFRNPDILFDTGKDQIKPQFQNILTDFFPRYVRIVTGGNYEGSIQEIRIEGIPPANGRRRRRRRKPISKIWNCRSRARAPR